MRACVRRHIENDDKSMMTAFSSCYYDGAASRFAIHGHRQPAARIRWCRSCCYRRTHIRQRLGRSGCRLQQLSAGYYPVVKALASELSAAASTYIQLPQGQTAAHFSGQATISGTMPEYRPRSTKPAICSPRERKHNLSQPRQGNGSAWISLTNGDYTRRLCLTTYKIALEGNGTRSFAIPNQE